MFHWVLLGFVRFEWVSKGFTRFYWVRALLGYTGFYWVLLGFPWFYWISRIFVIFTGFYWFPHLDYVIIMFPLLVNDDSFIENSSGWMASLNQSHIIRNRRWTFRDSIISFRMMRNDGDVAARFARGQNPSEYGAIGATSEKKNIPFAIVSILFPNEWTLCRWKSHQVSKLGKTR